MAQIEAPEKGKSQRRTDGDWSSKRDPWEKYTYRI